METMKYLLLAIALLLTACSSGGSGSSHAAPITYYSYTTILDAPGTSSSAAYKPFQVILYVDGRVQTLWTRNAGQLNFLISPANPLPITDKGWMMTFCQITPASTPGDQQLQVNVTNGSGSGEPSISWTFILPPPTGSG